MTDPAPLERWQYGYLYLCNVWYDEQEISEGDRVTFLDDGHSRLVLPPVDSDLITFNMLGTRGWLLFPPGEWRGSGLIGGYPDWLRGLAHERSMKLVVGHGHDHRRIVMRRRLS